MPIPSTRPDDDFQAAAMRHYDDAVLLAEQARPDNAVYLAGYVQECCLKVLLAAAVGAPFEGKHHGHAVEDLGRAGLTWLAATNLHSPGQLDRALQPGRVLDHAHPDRRYWPEVWSQADADEAVMQARDVLVELVWLPALRNGGGLP